MKHLTRIAAIVALILAVSLACGRPATTSAQAPQLGGCTILPANNVWNTAVDTLPVDKNSAAYIANISSTKSTLHPDFSSVYGGNYGIPYNIVPSGQPKLNVAFDYDSESDPGPYPIPANPPVEGGSDRHILMIEVDECKLYEIFAADDSGGSWTAGSGAIFDLRTNERRPDGWTSADAAGLAIFPGLVRYDEVLAGEIKHAIRFTADRTRSTYVWPASHAASSITDANVPPMGTRIRLKANVDISMLSPEAQVVARALKKYGGILADNGSDWYFTGSPDPRWDDDAASDIRQLHGRDFEVVGPEQ